MLHEWFSHDTGLNEIAAILGVFLGGGVVFLIFNFFISRHIVSRLAGCQTCQSDDINRKTKVYNKIALLFALTTVIILAACLPGIPLKASGIIVLVATCLLITIIAWFLVNLLDVVNARYQSRGIRHNHSIQGYIQTGKIIITVGATVLLMATLANKSPLLILSSFGAAAAVILLLFQHTLISLVANIQVSSSSAIRLGDWVEIPHLNINGLVTELALHTTTIKNWDNTVSRLPTKYFLTEHFTNWQPMFSSGGRRIMRSFYVDQKSIAFINQKITHSLNMLPEINGIRTAQPDASASACLESNLGLFRKYIRHYLEQRQDIRSDMYLIVRLLSPGPEGLPVEIYCFTSQVEWGEYERIQSEILEFVISVAHFFHLRIYQKPSGPELSEYTDNCSLR